MDLVCNPNHFTFFELCRISYEILKLKHKGHYKQPPLEMYTIGTLKKVKCILVS